MGGGGGYTIQNVSRCWAYETSLACKVDLPNELPKDLYFYEYFKNDPFLHIQDKDLFNGKNNVSTWIFNKDDAPEYCIY